VTTCLVRFLGTACHPPALDTWGPTTAERKGPAPPISKGGENRDRPPTPPDRAIQGPYKMGHLVVILGIAVIRPQEPTPRVMRTSRSAPIRPVPCGNTGSRSYSTGLSTHVATLTSPGEGGRHGPRPRKDKKIGTGEAEQSFDPRAGRLAPRRPATAIDGRIGQAEGDCVVRRPHVL